MWDELISKIDEMWGATLLTGLGVYGISVGAIDIAQVCVPGIVALLVAKTVRK